MGSSVTGSACGAPPIIIAFSSSRRAQLGRVVRNSAAVGAVWRRRAAGLVRQRCLQRQEVLLYCRCTAGASEFEFASVSNSSSMKTGRSQPVPPPTNKLLDIIRYSLAEDGGDQGDTTCSSTIPAGTKAKAQFVAKADRIIAGINLAEIIFREVDAELQSRCSGMWKAEMKLGIVAVRDSQRCCKKHTSS